MEKSKKLIIALLVLACILVVLIVTMIASLAIFESPRKNMPLPTGQSTASHSGSGFNVNLTIFPVPKVGETATLIFTSSHWGPNEFNDISAVSQIELPDGLNYVGGDLRVEHTIHDNVTIEAVVLVSSIGEYTIRAYSKNPVIGDSFAMGPDVIYLNVTNKGSSLLDGPFPPPPCENRYVNGIFVQCPPIEDHIGVNLSDFNR